MKRAAWLALSAFALAPGMAHAAPWSKAFVVDWLEPAFLHDGPAHDTVAPGKDCPAGTATNPGWKVELVTKWRDPKEIQYYSDAENRPEGIRAMRFRGPNYEDVWAHPELAPDLHALPAVSWNTGLGFNLDGKVKDTDFTSPDGLAGIDNNYYRAAGCWVSYRGPAYESQRGLGINGYMRDGLYTIVLVLSGNGDPMNDPDATLGIYQSKDKIVKDNQGHVAHDASYSIMPTTRTSSLLKVKVVNGVIETAMPQEIRIRQEAWNSAIPDQLQMTKGQLRLKMKDDGGFEGLIGGYVSWKHLYKQQAVPARDTETNQGIDMPTYYYQLQRYADADPDPKTGQNQRISTAFRLRAVPAFVLTPDYSKIVTIAQAFDEAAPRRLAQNTSGVEGKQ